MSKIEELNRLLTESAEVLVECCSILRDEPVNPEERNIYKLGKAIFEINEIRDQIYDSYPELKPKKWGVPPTEEDIDDMFQTASEMASEYINSGNYQKAIETFESFIYIGPTDDYKKRAEDEIVKIRQTYNV